MNDSALPYLATAVAERAPTLTLPRKRERERILFGATNLDGQEPSILAIGRTPSPACGGGLGWGCLRIGGLNG